MGTVDARIQVDDGKIENIKFFGDFFGPQDVTQLAEQLKGITYNRETLTKVLTQANTNQYIVGVTVEQLVDLLA